MRVKLLEVRDRMTFLPVMATKTLWEAEYAEECGLIKLPKDEK